MDTANVKVKKWGNSFGIILPRNIVNNQNIKEGIEIEVSVRTKDKTKASDLFGLLKERLTKDTDKLMDEVDRELWEGLK